MICRLLKRACYVRPNDCLFKLQYEIKLTEAISAPIVDGLRKQFEADARKKEEELAIREYAFSENTAEIERAKEGINAQIAEQL